MKVAYVTISDPSNRNSWSGITYQIAACLKAHGVEVINVGPLEKTTPFLTKLKNKILLNCSYRKVCHSDRKPVHLRQYAKQVDYKVKEINPDVILSPGTLPIAYCKTKVPCVVWTDATFGGIVGWYPFLQNLSPKQITEGHQTEQLALNRCQKILFSSLWASDSARDIYNISEKKLDVLSFGSNIDVHLDQDELEQVVIEKTKQIQIRLLFISMDWKRKGGEKVLELFDFIQAKGRHVRLDIVGTHPEINRKTSSGSSIVIHGRLDKNKPEDVLQLVNLYRKSNFFILPTEVDCTPIVFSEAFSFATPCLSTRVGGIPSMINDNQNGFLFDIDAPVSQWGEQILSVEGTDEYAKLSRSAYDSFTSEFNWDIAGAKLKSILENAYMRSGQ